MMTCSLIKHSLSALNYNIATKFAFQLVKSNCRTFKVFSPSFCNQEHSFAPDFYTVLGINRLATNHDVKLAYFKRAKKYHPDNDTSDQARYMFQLVADAYDVLSDEKKRKEYDEYGHMRHTRGGRGYGPQRPVGHKHEDHDELYQKILKEATGVDGGNNDFTYSDHGSSTHGEDFANESRVTLSFEEAARGVEFDLHINGKVICPKCDGSKSELGYTWNLCPFCEATGYETEKIGHVMTRVPCSYCNGTKQYVKYKCHSCEGTGKTIRHISVRVRVPPGCEDGQVLRVPITSENYILDQEDFIYVYITVKKEDQPIFRRDDFHIISESDISISQALLGGTTYVKGLHRDQVKVEIPEFTDTFQSLVAYSEGILRSDGKHKGNHYVKVGIKVPSKLSAFQKQVWWKFAGTEDLQIGTVNGIETEFRHKFETNVIEATKIVRDFNPHRKTQTEVIVEGKMKRMFSRIFRSNII